LPLLREKFFFSKTDKIEYFDFLENLTKSKTPPPPPLSLELRLP